MLDVVEIAKLLWQIGRLLTPGNILHRVFRVAQITGGTAWLWWWRKAVSSFFVFLEIKKSIRGRREGRRVTIYTLTHKFFLPFFRCCQIGWFSLTRVRARVSSWVFFSNGLLTATEVFAWFFLAFIPDSKGLPPQSWTSSYHTGSLALRTIWGRCDSFDGGQGGVRRCCWWWSWCRRLLWYLSLL